jgi:ABC-type polysaccharide/polyol phosphate export permease
MVILLISSVILFAGSAWIFRFQWQRPLAISTLIVAYCLFACGLMAFIAALLRSERRVDVLSPVIPMGLAFVGGAMFPARQLPPLFRNHISPLMPNYWFIEGMRGLQSTQADSDWVWAVARLAIFGLVLILAAAWLFQHALRTRAE